MPEDKGEIRLAAISEETMASCSCQAGRTPDEVPGHPRPKLVERVQKTKKLEALEVKSGAESQFNSMRVRDPQRASPELVAWSSKMSEASTPTGVHPNQRQFSTLLTGFYISLAMLQKPPCVLSVYLKQSAGGSYSAEVGRSDGQRTQAGASKMLDVLFRRLHASSSSEVS